ncbi:MAG TPA: AAA family ATPase [Gammaproteobacteria bacterium]|nr:AAA family ATPase [Gammaproteobacteria bacterium]
MNDFYSGYGFRTEPFRLTPDPGFRFAHAAYTRAAEALHQALLERRGIAMLTGEPGTGKTTLVGDLLNRIRSERMQSAVLTSTQLDTDDLLRMIAQAFELRSRSSDRAATGAVIDQFLQRRAEAGQTTLLVVDEAQNLSVDALDALRLLNGGDDGAQPALDILLVGQGQLLEKLRLPELKLLSQRIVEAAHLGTLDPDETRAYIEHRLTHAGWQGKPQLTPDAYQLIRILSRGLPRYINKLCSRLLVHGGVEDKGELDAQDVLTVGREMRDELLVPQFAEADLDDALVAPSVQRPDHAEPPSRPAADGAPSAGHDSHGTRRRDATSIDRAYRPPEAESATADDGGAEPGTAEEDTARRGAAADTTEGNAPTPPRPARTAPERALVAGILALMVAVGYGIWRHHPQLARLLESGTGTPAVRHRQTTPAAARADGAVQRNHAAPSRPAAAHARGPANAGAAVAVSPNKPKPQPSGGVRQANAAPPATAPAAATGTDQANTPATPPDDNAGPASAASATAAAPAPPAEHKDLVQAKAADNPPATGGQTKTPQDTPATDQGTPPPAHDESSRPSLSELAAKARAAFDDYRLTIPAVGSAYYYYQLMLARAPNDPRARQGLQRIVQRYQWLAQRSLARQDYDRARNYIHRGLGVDPDNPGLVKLENRLPGRQPAARDNGSEGTDGTAGAAESGVPIPVTPVHAASP